MLKAFEATLGLTQNLLMCEFSKAVFTVKRDQYERVHKTRRNVLRHS